MWTSEEIFGALLWVVACSYLLFYKNSAAKEGRVIPNPLLRLIVGLTAFATFSAVGWVVGLPLATPMWETILVVLQYVTNHFF